MYGKEILMNIYYAAYSGYLWEWDYSVFTLSIFVYDISILN